MPRLEIGAVLDGASTAASGVPAFRPGDTVAGTVIVSAMEDVECNGLQIEVGWRTEGRGTRDSVVVDQRTAFRGKLEAGRTLEFPFDAKLPDGPWSYEGKLLRIVWQVEVKASIPWARDESFSASFVVAPAERDDVAGPF